MTCTLLPHSSTAIEIAFDLAVARLLTQITAPLIATQPQIN